MVGVVRWLFPFPAMATWHKDNALQSDIALRDVRPTRLAAGHGPVLEQPVPAMNTAIAKAERKLTNGSSAQGDYRRTPAKALIGRKRGRSCGTAPVAVETA